MSAGKFDARHVRISVGKSFNLGKSKNKVMPWGDFYRMFAEPTRTKERQRVYKTLPLNEKSDLKALEGWYLGAPIKGSKRNNQSINDRDIVTLDLDNMDVETYESIRNGTNPICRYEFIAHTTRSHSPEEPRLRVNLLLDEPCQRDQFMPLSRLLGHMIDPTMESVDKVSYRLAQMMFMPTASRDQEYVCFQNHGELVKVEEVLDSWTSDWRDLRSLPYADAEEVERKRARKAEDPWEKRGVIGAFCRAWPMESLIEEFLDDIYGDPDPQSREPRYTYLPGHGSHGLAIYDEGRFAYSNHGSDPAADQNLNAFDMIRIHMFGDRDADTDLTDKPITQWPSYKAAYEFAQNDEGCKAELLSDELDIEAMFDDISDLDEEDVAEAKAVFQGGTDVDELDWLAGGAPEDTGLPPHPEPLLVRKPKKGWVRDLETTDEGKLKSTLYNVTVILANDPRSYGSLARNLMSQKIVSRRPIKSKIKVLTAIDVPDKEDGLPWTDSHDATLRTILEAPSGKDKPGYGLKVSDRDLREAIVNCGNKFQFHPVIERIKGTKWDGKKRAKHVFVDYLQLEDTAYHRETARQFLLGCVARLFVPGHKFDFVPVISGPQGLRKSTFVEALAFGKWGAELTAEMQSDTDSVEQMLGKWILELGELATMRRGEVEAVKAFVTRREDRVRLSYDRRLSTFPRSCLFMGTTNSNEYLKDDENRRFWPLTMPDDAEEIDTAKLEREIDQIWAEVLTWYVDAVAKHNYRKLPFGLTGVALEQALRHQEMAREENAEDHHAAQIEHYLNTPVPRDTFLGEDLLDISDAPEVWVVPVKTCSIQLMTDAMNEEPRTMQQRSSLNRVVGSIMGRQPGWIKYAAVVKGTGVLSFGSHGRQRAFVREDATLAEIEQGYRVVQKPEEPEDLI